MYYLRHLDPVWVPMFELDADKATRLADFSDEQEYLKDLMYRVTTKGDETMTIGEVVRRLGSDLALLLRAPHP